MYILQLIFLPIILLITAFAMNSKKTVARKKYAIISVSEIILFVSAEFFNNRFSLRSEHAVPAFIHFFLVLLPYLSYWCTIKEKEKIFRLLKKAAIFSFSLVFIEIFIFNFKSYSPEPYEVKSDFSEADIRGDIYEENNQLIINGDSEMIIDNVPQNTRCISLNISQNKSKNSRRFLVSLDMKDDNFKYSYKTVCKKYTSGTNEKLDLVFNPFQKLYSVKLGISEINETTVISSLTYSTVPEYSFSVLRFLTLLTAGLSVIFIIEFRIYEIPYNPKRLTQKLTVLITAVICSLSMLLYLLPDNTTVSYDKNDFNFYSDPFAMTFDAFENDRLYLREEADVNLSNLENVYDPSERDQAGVYSLWDYCYYNGHYYCYFGVTPVLVFYYPFYWITGVLPSISVVLVFFCTISVLFMCLTIEEIAIHITKKTNLLMLIISMPVSEAILGVFLIANNTNKYSIPSASGFCFLFISLYFGIKACYTSKKILWRMFILFICGTSLALCAGSRPTLALSAILLIPLFLGILADKNQKIASKILQVVCFAVPVISGAGALMWYNYQRFGNPLEFGAVYQLTVSNINANKLDLSLLPDSIYYYLLSVPRPSATFPFFEPQVYIPDNFGRYIYIYNSTGIFSYLFITFSFIMILKMNLLKNKQNDSNMTNLQRKAFIISGLCMILIVAWMDFCVGGSDVRYVTDIMPLCVIISCSVMFCTTTNPKINSLRYLGYAGTIIITFSMSWLMAVKNKDCALSIAQPGLYDTLEKLLIFWK